MTTACRSRSRSAAADGLQARAVRLRRVHQPVPAAPRIAFRSSSATLETVVGGILRDWVKPDGSFRSRQLLVGWDNVPMHRWAQSQMFRSLAFYLHASRIGDTSDADVTPLRPAVPDTEQRAMCGISGQFNFAQTRARRAGRRSGAWPTRSPTAGPDDEGYFVAGPLGLGFRRLSIIDLAGGHQPMSDAEETVWVVFNGEIYNFKELRAELERRGHRFRTDSDTEVIVHGYKEWGTEVFDRLNGMFGLAIWDVAPAAPGRGPRRHGHQAGLLRDRRRTADVRLGDPRGARAPTPTPRGRSRRAESVPAYRYTPSPLTIFKGIRKLAPGTMLVVENGRVPRRALVQLHAQSLSQTPKDDDEATDELLDLYRARSNGT